MREGRDASFLGDKGHRFRQKDGTSLRLLVVLVSVYESEGDGTARSSDG
jgi:hypothetical protein